MTQPLEGSARLTIVRGDAHHSEQAQPGEAVDVGRKRLGFAGRHPSPCFIVGEVHLNETVDRGSGRNPLRGCDEIGQRRDFPSSTTPCSFVSPGS